MQFIFRKKILQGFHKSAKWTDFHAVNSPLHSNISVCDSAIKMLGQLHIKRPEHLVEIWAFSLL